VADDARLKLTFRLVPADDRPADPAVLDDIVRLVRQAVATVPKDAPSVTVPSAGFHEPTDEEKREILGLESRIENRIQEASAASQAAVVKRAETAARPDGRQQLADDARAAAERVVAVVQSALLRRVALRVREQDQSDGGS
jgi:hypothetical protein